MIEEQMQAQCATWFWNEYPKYRRLLHCNMNNQSHRIAGATAKAMGVVKGVSDLELIWFDVWFIELKQPGKVQSEEQKDFQAKVETMGHKYVIIFSFEEFKTLIWKIIGK